MAGLTIAIKAGMRFEALALCLAACSPYVLTVPIGPPSPPHPADCPITFMRGTPADAATRWRQVGAVCLSGYGSRLGSMTVEQAYGEEPESRALASAACRLGGEAVTPVGLCSAGHYVAIEFGVYASR